MRKIEGLLTSELKRISDSKNISSSEGLFIPSYRDLVPQIAQLSYLNKDYLLFFRGQAIDFKNKSGKSTFYPRIYREDYLTQRELNHKFMILDKACKLLKELFTNHKIEGTNELKRKKLIQWSILQHYEVCDTPLLDLTHSIRVACSFAQLENRYENGYVYVFGLPYLTNRISTNSEHDLVNIRLLSICPPEALRPYFQDGYVAGTEDITNDYENKSELDFNNRLIAKFRISNSPIFWEHDFSVIPKRWLYPENDRVLEICKQIVPEIKTELLEGDLGAFIKRWSNVESILVQTARQMGNSVYNISVTLRYLLNKNIINPEQFYRLDKIRKLRNFIVHEPLKLNSEEFIKYLNELDKIADEINQIKRNFQDKINY